MRRLYCLFEHPLAHSGLQLTTVQIVAPRFSTKLVEPEVTDTVDNPP